MPKGTKEPPSQFTLAVQAELKNLMEAKQWSQRDLEQHSGVGQSRIAQTIGTGAKSLDLNEFERICIAFGVSPEVVIKTAQAVLRARSQYDLAAYKAPANRRREEDRY